MIYQVNFSPSARGDLRRLYRYLLERATILEELELAERALPAIENAVTVHLAHTPFLYRKANNSGLRRELVIPFATTGYVTLYEIVAPGQVPVLAARHPLEQDYHQG